MIKASAVLMLVFKGLSAFSQTLYVPSGTPSGIGSTTSGNTNIGIGNGNTNPAGLLHLRTPNNANYWSSNNFGINLVIDGPHHNSIGFLDAGSANPIAITNISGSLTFSKMPALGDVSTAPTYLMSVVNTGNVGIGTTSPGAMLEVKNSSNLGTSAGNNLLLTRVSGAGNANYFMNNTWLYRDASGSDWLTARLHNGISIDGSFLTPGIDTRTWWERAPFHDIQSFGTGSTAYLTINAGNVGIGTTAPYEILNVAKTGNNQLVLQDLSSAADGVGGGLKFMGYTNGTAGGSYFATIQGVKAPTTPGGILKLSTSDNVGNSFERFRIDNLGNVGIGTTSPDALLAVKGTIHSKEVKVDLAGAMSGPDYVFEKDYKLLTLDEIKCYIDQNKHLPEVPSAAEMEKKGLLLGEMNMLLLKKVEELTLYVIEMNKKVEELNCYVIGQNEKIKELSSGFCEGIKIKD